MRHLAPTTRRTVATLAALVCLGACGGSSKTAEDATSQEAATEAVTPATAAAETTDLVDLAVTVAKAIERAPDEATSILAANGLTPERWTTMMQDIAADSTLSRTFLAAMQP